MASNDVRPFLRNRSRTILVDGVSWDGPCRIEVQREEWLSRKTNRYGVVWSARKAGAFGWETVRSPRTAIARAGFVKPGTRPRWLADAVERATRELA